MIAGIAVGAAAVVIIAALVAVFLFMKIPAFPK